jgi:hypothetical protein
VPLKFVETASASPWLIGFSMYCKRWAAALEHNLPGNTTPQLTKFPCIWTVFLFAMHISI